MAEVHKSWVSTAAEKSFVRFEDATVKVSKDVAKGITADVVEPFKAAIFVVENATDLAALWALAESSREDVKDDQGNVTGKTENPINTLLTYAYGLTCRQRVRQNVESRFEDPDKGARKVADLLVKMGKFTTIEKALAFVKASGEATE